jgi:hypothetical protein
MSESAIPDDVRHLLETGIRSVVELELLLALRQQHGRAWTPEEAAQALDVDVRPTERMLFDLMARGLIAVVHVVPIAYQYAPRTPELRATIGRLADLYAARRLAVASLIGQRPADSLRLFSDAFRLRRDE